MTPPPVAVTTARMSTAGRVKAGGDRCEGACGCECTQSDGATEKEHALERHAAVGDERDRDVRRSDGQHEVVLADEHEWRAVEEQVANDAAAEAGDNPKDDQPEDIELAAHADGDARIRKGNDADPVKDTYEHPG